MKYDFEVVVSMALVVYLLVWYAMVKVLKRMNPSDAEDYITSEYDETPTKFSDLIVGISSLWPLWLVMLLMHIAYVAMRWVVRTLLKLV